MGTFAARMVFRCANAPVSLFVFVHLFMRAVFTFDLLSPDKQMKSNQEKKNWGMRPPSAQTRYSFLSSFDARPDALASGRAGCGVSPPYMFLYVTPLSVPLYVIYYYIVWRTFLFGLRIGYIVSRTKASARRTNHLIFCSVGGCSLHELDTLKSSFMSCSSGCVLRCSGCGTV